MYIYRVMQKYTGSLQPGGSDWVNTVLYVGDDLTEARMAFLESEVSDYSKGYGNSARRTVIEMFPANPEDIEDTTPQPLNMED